MLWSQGLRRMLAKINLSQRDSSLAAVQVPASEKEAWIVLIRFKFSVKYNDSEIEIVYMMCLEQIRLESQ